MTKRKDHAIPTIPDLPVKATDAEIASRVAKIHKFIVAGASRATIVQYGSTQWSISDRQVDDYIASAKKILVAQTDRDKDNNLALALERMQEIYQQCMAAKNFKGAIASQVEINKLLGLYAPTQQEVKLSGEVKTYKTFSPDDWDSDAEPPTPDS